MDTVPSKLSAAAISSYAEQIADHYGIFSEGSAADLGRLVQALGGEVEVSNSPIAQESLTVNGARSFTVHLPPFTGSRRDRFTIAHELGHYFLHYLYPQHKGMHVFSRGGSNLAEYEANHFASCLLMPTEMYEKAYGELDGDHYALSKRFDVSPAASRVRAKVLRLGSGS